MYTYYKHDHKSANVSWLEGIRFRHPVKGDCLTFDHLVKRDVRLHDIHQVQSKMWPICVCANRKQEQGAEKWKQRLAWKQRQCVHLKLLGGEGRQMQIPLFFQSFHFFLLLLGHKEGDLVTGQGDRVMIWQGWQPWQGWQGFKLTRRKFETGKKKLSRC